VDSICLTLLGIILLCVTSVCYIKYRYYKSNIKIVALQLFHRAGFQFHVTAIYITPLSILHHYSLHYSNIPLFRHSIIPLFHNSIIPPFHNSIIPSTIPIFHYSIIPSLFHYSTIPFFHITNNRNFNIAVN